MTTNWQGNSYIPMLDWVREYRKEWLRLDVIAGLTTAAVVIPNDKSLYDRLLSRDAAAVRAHLWADMAYQNKLARFLENHDEPRAAHDFPQPVHQAAAVVTYFTPGLRFFHEGQLEGRRVKVSMHLGRRPEEAIDPILAWIIPQESMEIGTTI